MQLSINILLSLIMLTYNITVKPWTVAEMNTQEIYNEAIILICGYHMLFFGNWISDTATVYGHNFKSVMGFSMISFILLGVVINIVIIIRAAYNEYQEYKFQKKLKNLKKE